MSIYSGFATRQQQQSYDQCLQTAVFILQTRLIRFYKNEVTDEDKFFNLLHKLYSQMKSMQTHKYLQPKSSRTFEQLLYFLKAKRTVQSSALVKKQALPQEQGKEEASKKETNNDQKRKQIQTERQDSKFEEQQRVEIKLNLSKEEGANNDDQSNTKRNSVSKNRNSNNIYNMSQINQKRLNEGCVKNSEDLNEEEKEEKKLRLYIKNNQFQNYLNVSGARLVKVSRDQPRAYNLSHNQIRRKKSTTRSKSKRRESEASNTEQNLTGKLIYEKEYDLKHFDVQELIQGYINKTKKNYMKNYSKKKGQIEQMFKLME